MLEKHAETDQRFAEEKRKITLFEAPFFLLNVQVGLAIYMTAFAIKEIVMLA